MAIFQKQRFCTLTTPLGANTLLIRRVEAREGVSCLFEAAVEAESERSDIDPHEIVGKTATIQLETATGTKRALHGVVTRFEQRGRNQRVTHYRLELRPWLWLLTRRAGCRIFQNMSVPDIVEEVFQKAGFTAFVKKLQGSYKPRGYCVQYRETDFAFVSRLLEEEGIFYFFEHSESKHELVLADATSDLPDCPEQPSVDYQTTEGGQDGRDVILGFETGQEFHPGKYSLKDYNFEDPTNPLLVSTPTIDAIGSNQSFEVYDYHPEDYPVTGEGDRLARIRMQERETMRVRARGQGSCRAFVTGHRFTLEKHYREALNGKKFVLTAVRHELTQPSQLYSESHEAVTCAYANEFECVPVETPLRAPSATQKPFVRGPQTAVVVGPAGEEIYVDKYGRIKVQFHWDRLGKKDDKSSCWIRVSQMWAGKQWGGLVHPRIGDEVIVEFLEGDPDRPIVTGCVYNAKMMPPYDLPANKTQSGLKSRSSPGGSPANFNELRFEDKKGNEEVYIQAEKNKRVLVKNDRSENVGHDETITIGNDRTETVGHDEKITIKNDRTENVINNETITIGVDRKENVGSNETISIGVNRTETVGANETVTIGANKTVTVAANHTESVGANQSITIAVMKTENVGVASMENVGAAKTVTVGAAYALTVGAAMNVAVGGLAMEEVGSDKSTTVAGEAKTKAKKIILEADDEIEIKSGAAKITLKKSGDITIEGTKIEIKGAAMIDAKAALIKLNS